MDIKRTLIVFLAALCVSAIWTWFNKYEYVGSNTYLFGRMNIFPLTLWTLGLTALYLVHTKMPGRFRFFKTSLLYLIALGILEAFGYHVLNIRLNSNEPSLFNLGIIHAKPHMKFFYIVAGPVFVGILSALFYEKKNIRS